MQQLGVKIADNQYRIMLYADMTGLNVVKDDRNNVYLEGDVTFTDEDYNWLITRKVYDYDIQLEVRWEGFNGVMSLAGEWNYDRKRCKLKVSGNNEYDRFKTILTKEYKPLTSKAFYNFDSYLDYKWSSSEIVDDVYPDYTNTGNVTPDSWDNTTTYIAANIEPDGSGGFYYYGNPISFVSHNGKRWACQITNTNSEPSAGNSDWVDITISTVIEYAQERALFQFNNAEYDEENNYWFEASTSTDSYSDQCYILKIKDVIEDILEDNSFSLSSDWMPYVENINSDYKDRLVIASTKTIEKIKLQELIEYIENAFNVKHYINGTELFFLHWTEQQEEWDASLPIEHDLSNIDIYDWTREEFKDVKRHKLNFTESGIGTHDNSVIEYDNLYFKDEEVKPAFDVDFVYSINEGDINCLATLESSSNEIKQISGLYNPYLIPSDIHENFYFSGREYNRGTFQENLVSLQEDYNETTERQLSGNYDINNWNVFNLIRINGLTGKTTYNYAKLDKVVYSIDKNNFKLSLKTKT